MLQPNKDLEQFKKEYEETILALETRISVLEKTLVDLQKLLRETQSGVRNITKTDFVTWGNISGTLGDTQKTVRDIAETLGKNKKNRDIGYETGNDR